MRLHSPKSSRGVRYCSIFNSRGRLTLIRRRMLNENARLNRAFAVVALIVVAVVEQTAEFILPHIPQRLEWYFGERVRQLIHVLAHTDFRRELL